MSDGTVSEEPMQEPLTPAQLGRVHLLGLAGVGVSAVARLLQAAGVPISGTDGKELPVLDEFRAAGASVRVGYRSENIASVERETGERISTIIASSVAAEGNPEYDEAQRRGLRVLHRSEGLAAVMVGRRSVAVAGTHGKTTTSSMTTVLLEQSGLEPSFAVGATVAGLGVNAASGAGDWFVAEADESDGSLLNYRPEVAIITNVEADHLDHHGTAEAVHQVFVDFTQRILDGGELIICRDDSGARRLLEQVSSDLTARGVTVTSYGTSSEADLRLEGHAEAAVGALGQRFTVRTGQGPDAEQAQVSLAVPGLHNAMNALAALAVGLRAGLDLHEGAQALEHFQGAARRFDHRGEHRGVRVYDDYAHHPTEVAAVLTAARSAVGEQGRVHVVFQPHLFSRTQLFAQEFAQALAAADTVAVLDIYPAREEPIAGVTSELIAEPLFARAGAPAGGRLDRREAVRVVAGAAGSGDIILTLGAGDVTALGPDLVEALRG
ncbi:UDP-N-acetylmuramate--L-alanine ligase [Nesterenkonia xinjiangensis]|uniref:UDP-N-acetylmuramate--L-alanine ligase n=1 Tax=Nesterenkonia xinjiangensis TaxID=225327 RepID=A0A7Z0GNI7_9MICC|nr:UDP-N-acetylmuramate--L-alanine ligase [Nesterenkonia xinjiangensis]NYJ79256.1 UDP-N-acetylmuramate--alanine ligase [Nesterenkonia xinjiangensis]